MIWGPTLTTVSFWNVSEAVKTSVSSKQLQNGPTPVVGCFLGTASETVLF